jgi:hypothetical protein
MDIHTIPDSFADDLRRFFLKNPPVAIDAKNVRLQHDKGELESPRLELACGDAKRVPQMDGTARVPVTLAIVTSMDRNEGDQHRKLAGDLQTWWTSLRSQRRSMEAFGRCYLHDFLVGAPSTVERKRDEHREQVTTLRADAIVTLFADPELI